MRNPRDMEDAAIAFTNSRQFSMQALEQAALNRLPGYMDAVREVGQKITDEVGREKAYRLTTEQLLDLKRRFNPDDADGIRRLEAAVTFNRNRAEEREWLEPMLQQVLDDSVPCQFPGCAELKSEYQRDVILLGEDCASCELTALRTKFRELLKRHLARQ